MSDRQGTNAADLLMGFVHFQFNVLWPVPLPSRVRSISNFESLHLASDHGCIRGPGAFVRCDSTLAPNGSRHIFIKLL